MPSSSPVGYLEYTLLRIITVISYVSAAVSSYSLVINGFTREILRQHAAILIFVIFSGLYIYFAQIYNIWEPSRNRMGTGGQNFQVDQVEFQYIFHRALGTFREPSHLAIWLVATVMFLMPQKNLFKNTLSKSIIIVLSIFLLILTGSLLGIICLIVGLMTFSIAGGRMGLLVSGLLVALMLILSLIADAIFGVDLLAALGPRFEEIASGGLSASNRSDTYNFLEDNYPTIIGVGIGHSALIFSASTDIDLISPLLNLFLNIWYESGIIGVICILTSFITPFFLFGNFHSPGNSILVGGILAHICWLLAYFGMVPELSPYHATAIGMFFGNIYLIKYSKNLNKKFNKLSKLN
jgi:hypothetical protein